jgi:lysophospholipase L1-like esterase
MFARRRRRWPACLAVLLASACSRGSNPVQPTPTPPAPTPPVLSLVCPTSIDTFVPQGESRPIEFAAPQVEGGTAPVEVTCQPQSGAAFAVGDTTVTCTGRDTANQQGVCTFLVHVDPPPPRIGVTEYLAFGDSLTEGRIFTVASGRSGSPDSYPFILESLLGGRYRAQTVLVVNSGLGGESTIEGRARLRALLAREAAPAILLLEGSNDLAFLAVTGRGTGGFSEVRRNIDGMVRDAQSAGRQVFLGTLPPQREGGARAEAAKLVTPFNDQLRIVANTRKIPLVDVHGAVAADMSLVGPDGLHLTAAGYARIAQTFADAVERALEVR